jgi:hypothetical protein
MFNGIGSRLIKPARGIYEFRYFPHAVALNAIPGTCLSYIVCLHGNARSHPYVIQSHRSILARRPRRTRAHSYFRRNKLNLIVATAYLGSAEHARTLVSDVAAIAVDQCVYGSGAYDQSFEGRETDDYVRSAHLSCAP